MINFITSRARRVTKTPEKTLAFRGCPTNTIGNIAIPFFDLKASDTLFFTYFALKLNCQTTCKRRGVLRPWHSWSNKELS
ncbi:hypothetical protein MSBRM_2282 [Methanosarcina barkeri MS]|uniref:Uncharacterized protein n=1 Tax=Methanosarcina barkeri MS TaxID=1434108 RepID=A0A0E3QWZ3_METBA|nr:hypothetical protein MSBRM_2282 [Methanosarcina barkeri MS]